MESGLEKNLCPIEIWTLFLKKKKKNPYQNNKKLFSFRSGQNLKGVK